ncbi:Zip domain containing protein [Asbolus verrucosus]|uniref:Zip domain containing protein n=1 Tax=Asbolus verrucosus TaxID=1661398 RepID=A0A482W6Y8_ASBVE|nr:Zip domain containing protein [Asbolus verrucosus]
MEAVTKNATNSEETNNLILAKAVAMCVLGLASFLIGILPIKLTKLINIKSVDGDKNLLISLLLCFGGGVLLFTTFIHLQPEVRESFMMLESHNKIPSIGSGIPMSELVFCLGFFFVYLIEELVHLCLHRKLNDDALHRSLSIRCSNKKRNLTIPRVTLNKFDDGNISYISNSNKELLNSQSTINFEKHSHSHHHIDGALKNSFSGLLAVLALSFHAVFEGLAVGLEGSVQRVWYLFAAIATHKLVIAFCVGVELVTSKTRMLLVILYTGTFAIVTPLGKTPSLDVDSE